jgi:uncharacterized protein (DUF111 family)
MAIQTIGYGAGDRDFPQQPNIVRLLVGTQHGAGDGWEMDEVMVLETNLDDVSPEWIGYALQRLWDAGALDVYTTAIAMKKNRPGTKITVLAAAAQQAACEEILAVETGTLGIRRWPARRSKLAREGVQVDTPWGPVRGKQVRLPDGTLNFAPEYDDCQQLAQVHRLPLRDVYQAARQAFASRQFPG